MKELALVYLALLITIAGCTSAKKLYPSEPTTILSPPTDGMIRAQMVNGARYFAAGFRIERDTLILLPPVATSKDEFKALESKTMQILYHSDDVVADAALGSVSLPADSVASVTRNELNVVATVVGGTLAAAMSLYLIAYIAWITSD